MKRTRDLWNESRCQMTSFGSISFYKTSNFGWMVWYPQLGTWQPLGILEEDAKFLLWGRLVMARTICQALLNKCSHGIRRRRLLIAVQGKKNIESKKQISKRERQNKSRCQWLWIPFFLWDLDRLWDPRLRPRQPLGSSIETSTAIGILEKDPESLWGSYIGTSKDVGALDWDLERLWGSFIGASKDFGILEWDLDSLWDPRLGSGDDDALFCSGEGQRWRGQFLESWVTNTRGRKKKKKLADRGRREATNAVHDCGHAGGIRRSLHLLGILRGVPGNRAVLPCRAGGRAHKVDAQDHPVHHLIRDRNPRTLAACRSLAPDLHRNRDRRSCLVLPSAQDVSLHHSCIYRFSGQHRLAGL